MAVPQMWLRVGDASGTVAPQRAGRIVGRATICFVDAGRWESFHQVAGLLRRSGCRCIRVTSEPSALKRSISRVLFHEVHHLSLDDMAGWLSSESAAGLTDLLITDEAVALITDLVGPIVAPSMPSTPSSDALMLSRDKLRQAVLFDRHGIPQPRFLPASDASVECAVDALGLPLVVKRALGYGGYGVKVVPDADAAHEAVAALAVEGSVDGLFFQQMIVGDEYCYGCSAVDGRVLQEFCYRRTGAVREFGQSTCSVTFDDPDLRALGRSVVALLGSSGFFNLGAIRDPDGRYQIIDVNPRPWGGFASLLDLGIDLSEGYLHAIGAVAEPPEHHPVGPDQPFVSFPFWHEAALVGDGVTAENVRSYVQTARTYRRSISTRYWLETIAFTSLHVMRRRPEARAQGRGAHLAPTPSPGVTTSS